MGKYTQKYKTYIEKATRGESCVKGSVNHTFCAVIYLFEKYHVGKPQNFQTLTCEIISYAIGAHHGEFDFVDLDSNSGFEHRIYKDKDEVSYTELLKEYVAPHTGCVD